MAVTVSLISGKLTADLYVKPTDRHQDLSSSSCYPYHCKKRIPCSQAVSLNRICADSISCDKRCNDLEKWLMKRVCSEREVRRKTLRTKRFSKDSLLDGESTREEHNKITLNLTYYPVFQKVKEDLSRMTSFA